MDDRELRASLRHLPDARPGADFTAEVLARVDRRERSRRSGDAVANGGGWLLPGRRGTLVAAALAAAVVAAVGLWRPGGEWWAGGAPEAASPGGGERVDEGETEGRRPAAAERTGAKSSPRGGDTDDRKDGRAVAPPAQRSREDREPTSSGAAGAAEGDAAPAPETGGPGAAGYTAADADGDEGDRVAALAEDPREDRRDREHGSPAAGRPATVVAGASPAVASPAPPLVDRGSAPPADAEARLAAADFFAAPPTDPAAELLADRLARLAAERERLAARLAEFRREVPPAEPPVVLLGADEGLELVFDVGRFAAGRQPAGEVRPAVHSTTGPPRR